MASRRDYLDVKWGEIRYQPAEWKGKDLLLSSGVAKSWDWKVNGTKHVPGIALRDVTDSLKRDTRIILLTLGMDNVLEISKELQRWIDLNADKYEIYVDNTKTIVRFYNSLSKRDQQNTLLLLHSTC